MDQITVACVQQRLSIQPTREDFETEARRFLRQAQAKSARIVLFPELTGLMLAPPLISGLKLGFIKQEDQSKRPGAGLLARTMGRVAGSTAGALGGGFWGSLERLVRKKSDTFLDVYLDTFGGFAREYGMVVVGGSLYLQDPETGEVRHRAYVFDNDGQVLGYQDKFNLTAGEAGLASPASDLTVINTRHGRLGLLLGRDSLYPELARLLALQNADLIAGLAASPGAAQARIVRQAMALRAEENQVFGAACFLLGPNYVDRGPREDFFGQSALLAPISLTRKGDGVLVEAGTDRTEGLIAADLAVDELYELRQSSRFRPRQEMHLGNMGAVLADFYRQGLTIDEAIVEDLAGIGEPAELGGPGEEDVSVAGPFVKAPPIEAAEAEPPQPSAAAWPVPEAMSLTDRGEDEETDQEG